MCCPPQDMCCRQYAAPGCEIQHAANGRQYAAAGNMLLPLELSLRDSICCCRLCCRCEIQDAAAACVVAARFNMLLTAGNMLQLAARFNMLLAAGNMRISQLLLLHYFLYRVEVEKRAILKNESGGKASLPKMPAYFHKSETRSAGHSRSRWHRLYIADFSR